jgi:hypothetical protein
MRNLQKQPKTDLSYVIIPTSDEQYSSAIFFSSKAVIDHRNQTIDEQISSLSPLMTKPWTTINYLSLLNKTNCLTKSTETISYQASVEIKA